MSLIYPMLSMELDFKTMPETVFTDDPKLNHIHKQLLYLEDHPALITNEIVMFDSINHDIMNMEEPKW